MVLTLNEQLKKAGAKTAERQKGASISELGGAATSNLSGALQGSGLTAEQIATQVRRFIGGATADQLSILARPATSQTGSFQDLVTQAGGAGAVLPFAAPSRLPTQPTKAPTVADFNNAGVASSTLQSEIESAEKASETARLARERIIRSDFGAEIAEQRRIGEAEISGTRAQLGIARGVGRSSSREQFVQAQRESNIRIIANLKRQQEVAIIESDLGRLDQLRADIRDAKNRDFQERQAAFQNSLALLSATANRDEQQRIATNQVRDDARSILSLVLTNFSGADVSSLPSDILNSFGDLERQAGLPVGFTRQGLISAREQASLARQQLAEDKQVFSEEIQNLRLEVSQFRANLSAAQQATGNTIIISPTGETFNIAPHKQGGGTSSVGNDLFSQAQTNLAINTGDDGNINTEVYKKWLRTYRNADPIRGVDAFLVDFPLTLLNLETDQSAINFVKSLIETGGIKEVEGGTSDNSIFVNPSQ